MKNQNRDLELESIVGNMLISQYQIHKLKSRIADRFDEWWNSSYFVFIRHGKEFKVSLKVDKFNSRDLDDRPDKCV
jgi:hypothetical protein